MSIKDDFADYWDNNGLLTPSPRQSSSDNGPLFTSDFYIILKKNGQLTEQDKLDYAQKIESCIGPEGLLNRVPVGHLASLEGPDDVYGVTDACIELGNTSIPRKLLWDCVKYFGSFNNINPGKWTSRSFLIRQPQLLCAIVNASFPSFLNPLHWLVRLSCAPLYWVAAISIAISCMGTDIGNTDSRMLAWHLQNNTKKTSILCWLASLVWNKRLANDYKNKMKDVSGIYFSPNGLNNNPYSKYWTD